MRRNPVARRARGCARCNVSRHPSASQPPKESQSVTRSEKQWLSAVPWESVITLNKALCQAQKVEPTNNKGYEAGQRLWEKAVPKAMELSDALKVCRDCHDLCPFTFNNGNTFAAIGRTLVEDFLKQMPPVE